MKTYRTFLADENGCFGNFGGAYIPEQLKKCIDELRENYYDMITAPDFREEYDNLLQNYVGRPSPLYFANRLSDKYKCRIYLKREDLNHTGAHKINNTIGQVLLAGRMGKKRIIAETGAGQHGLATATVCALMGMECTIYMGEMDMQRQQLNVEKMKMLGAQVVPVKSGSGTLTNAVDAALQDWCSNEKDTFYIIGSAVGPHPYPDMVSYFQSVISREIKYQLLEQEGRDYPDYLIACVGGGSNASGTMFHYIDEPRTKIVLAEAAGKGLHSGYSAATVNEGVIGILHGSKSLVMQDENGELKEAYSISAGLDYPGVGPMIANLSISGKIDVQAVTDEEAVAAAFELTKMEGIIPALESSHALGLLPKLNAETNDVVVITVSGRGDKDMVTYTNYL
ncbi:MAG: tryptophan synthase subunit beta [Bacteroidales bacterium]|nr:tryptophan synthase subunit beta [Bacteroidales bacterium]MDD4669825.1 tryptophan synthase subunit beta [Bacteroidales bacterium]